MQYAPILISVYNRYAHFKKCIQALQQNTLATESNLYIVSDAASKEDDEDVIEQIRAYVNKIRGFNNVTLLANPCNKGSVQSINDARKFIFSKYDRYIFMEDDIQVGPYFLDYMNTCLDKYASYNNVFAISGYNHSLKIPKKYPYDVYFIPSCPAWGIAYWRDKHQKYDENVNERFLDFVKENEHYLETFKKYAYTTYKLLLRNIRGEINSGDTRKTFYEFSQGLVTAIPVNTLTKNNGNDGSGEHCPYDYVINSQKVDLMKREFRLPDRAELDPRFYKEWSRYFSNFHKKKRVLIRYFYYITVGVKIFIRDLMRKLNLKKA